MIYNTVELDTLEPIETYQKEPSWIDTFKASTKNFTSVSLSHSRDDYYKSEMETNTKEWSAKDPGNKDLYGRISGYAYKDIEQLEALYDEGNIDAIKTYKQVNPFNTDVFLSEDFLRYKELQGQQGLKPVSQIREDINTRAVKDFEESSQVIAQSDSLSAELAGTMYGALHDTKTLQTLPLGTWKTGGTVMANAGRAIAEEMGIEALAQVSIAHEVYSFKKEIGLKTSIANEAYNAVASIATAGLVRGAGSATFDLTAKGVKALKAKDPKLAQDYVNLSKDQPTQDLKTHTDNMNKVEFSGEPLEKITNPNEKGVALNEAPTISEVDIAIKEPDLKYNVEQSYSPSGRKIKGITISDDVGSVIESEDMGNGVLEVYNSSVSDEYKRQGRGTGLYSQLIKEAKKDGYNSIRSDSSVSEPASKIWEKLGAEKTSSEIEVRERGITEGAKQFLTEDNSPMYKLDITKEIPTHEIEIKTPETIPDDMRIVVDKDIEGEVTTRSYAEINQELDENDIMFKKISDCLLGVE